MKISTKKKRNHFTGLSVTFQQKKSPGKTVLNWIVTMRKWFWTTHKQCHLPFSLLIGNPGSPVMKVGCSPSTVWKRGKKEHVKFIFRGKNWISFLLLQLLFSYLLRKFNHTTHCSKLVLHQIDSYQSVWWLNSVNSAFILSLVYHNGLE